MKQPGQVTGHPFRYGLRLGAEAYSFLEEVRPLPIGADQTGGGWLQAVHHDEPLPTRGGQLLELPFEPLDPLTVGLDRCEVRLGKVPIVERILLRPQRKGDASSLVPVASLLDERPTSVHRRSLPVRLVPQSPLDASDRVQVLDLDLYAQLLAPIWTDRDVRVTSKGAFLHTD